MEKLGWISLEKGHIYFLIGIKVMGPRNSIIYKLTTEELENLHKFGVYMISNKTNNIKYIGSTTMLRGFLTRWNGHLSDLRLKKHHSNYLQNHVNKYGVEDLQFSILEILEDPKLCRIREKYWLDYYGFENTFNISRETDISVGGKTHPCYIPIDDEKVIMLFNKGVKLSKMAKELGVNKPKIISTLRLNGIDYDYIDSLPLKEIYYRNVLGGEKLKDIVKEYNISRTALERRFRKIGLYNRFQIVDAYFDRFKEHVKKGGEKRDFCKKLPIDVGSLNKRLKNEEKK